jgi:hypothetical protein
MIFESKRFAFPLSMKLHCATPTKGGCDQPATSLYHALYLLYSGMELERIRRYLAVNVIGVLALAIGLLSNLGLASGLGIGLIVGSNLLLK